LIIVFLFKAFSPASLSHVLEIFARDVALTHMKLKFVVPIYVKWLQK